jgi:tetratricopeptide (TPR) repeat protein
MLPENPKEMLKRVDEVVKRVRAVSKDDDTYLAPYFALRGTLLNQMGRYDEALISFDKAISLDVHNETDAWYNRGVMFLERDNLDEALRSFNKMLEINPNDEDAIHNRKVVLLKQSQRYGK